MLENSILPFRLMPIENNALEINESDLNACNFSNLKFNLVDIQGSCYYVGDIQEIIECFTNVEFRKCNPFIKVIKYPLLLLKLLVQVYQRQRQFIAIYIYKNIGLIFKNMDDNSGANYFDHFKFDQNTIFHFNKNYLYDNNRIYKYN